jgi:hypothetical protein
VLSNFATATTSPKELAGWVQILVYVKGVVVKRLDHPAEVYERRKEPSSVSSYLS